MPTLPVRLAKIGSHRAIDAQFQGVPFETFIVCDNLYQGYLATKQDNLLDELAAHLYGTQRIRLTFTGILSNALNKNFGRNH